MRDEFFLYNDPDDECPPPGFSSSATFNASEIDVHVIHSRLIEDLARGDADAVADLKALADHLYRDGTERTCPPIYLTLVEEAHALAQDGLFADAARRLECCVRPKWGTLQACDLAFARAVARTYGPPTPRPPLDLFGLPVIA